MPPIPVVPESQSHLLAELDCLDPLLSALRLDSGRLKCTCLAVSKKWLALGTSAGGLHLIQREGWKQRLILTHKEGSIIQVACCPSDEDFIAVATSQGLLVVWELQLERRGRPEKVSMSWEHRGQLITSLCWDSGSLRVFAGDTGGKVSFLRAGSSKLGKTVMTVDSRVVQLGYQDGRLLVSSLSRCYLCDTEREKFWRIGNKERDGEYGACFFPQSRGVAPGQPPLLYCARPGSRMWESSFSGEVLSTHQFKQLLACPPLPLISYKGEPHYSPALRSSQSVAFSKLLYLGDQHLLTWTDSAIYIFRPQSAQVLLWSEIKDVVDIAVHRSELFCLHGNGQLSHLSLLSADRCAERLLRREMWWLAAAVCCMFPHAVIPSRTRKLIPIDRMEHLRSQLSPASHLELMAQLDEVISKLEPLDSASSSRRSSISSHESFNVLDCGIYRVVSRRGSQSEEETGSFINQSLSEEERLKEFGVEEDQGDHDPLGAEAERAESGMPFHLPLSFRTKPPRIALQAVKDSVSSFVKKTTEKINTLQMNTDLWQRSDTQVEVLAATSPSSEDMENEVCADMANTVPDLHDLRTATERATSQILDPFVLMDPAALDQVLLEWLQVLERVLGAEEPGSCSEDAQPDEARPREDAQPDEARPREDAQTDEARPREDAQPDEARPREDAQTDEARPREDAQPDEARPREDAQPDEARPREDAQTDEARPREDAQPDEARPREDAQPDEARPREALRLELQLQSLCSSSQEPTGHVAGEHLQLHEEEHQGEGDSVGPESTEEEEEEEEEEVEEEEEEEEEAENHCHGTPEPVRVEPPTPLPSELLGDLTQLATLYLELSCFRRQLEERRTLGVVDFLRRYFFLLDKERVRRMCLLCHREEPEVHSSFVEAMQELTRSSKVVEVIQKGDLLKSLRGLRELQPWSASELLAHSHRLYEKHGEAAVRSFSQFYPTLTPTDVMVMAQQPHFLAYLDNLVQSRAEEQRLSFLGSLLQPESLRQDWLELGLTNDAPQPSDTLTADGQPSWHSHFFSWGYGRLLSLLIRLPADLSSKERMAETCRSHGYWTGYLFLCCELQRRTEAFSTICRLDDISLLEESQAAPQTVQEWKLLLQLSQECSSEPPAAAAAANGTAQLLNGSAVEQRRRQVTPENLTLRLARTAGPDRALEILEECGLPLGLSPHSSLVCELLRVAEKRQRATIQTMLERCDRFLWSQHA